MKKLTHFLLPVVSALLLVGCAAPVTLYTDADRDAVKNLTEPFTARTGISVDVVEFGGAHELADAIAAYSGGKYAVTRHETLYNYADVAFSTDIMLGEALKTRDMLAPYEPKAAETIPPGAKRDGWWYGVGGHACVVAWNTDLVKGEPPSSLMDLAGAGFPKGSVALLNPNYMLYYMAGACSILGKDRMVPFLQTMIDRSAQWEADAANTARLVADGKAWACLTTLAHASALKAGGAHIAWAVPDQGPGQMGAYVQYNVVCVPKVSTMPKEAAMLADYLLSPEAEALSVKLGLSDVTLRSCGSDAPVVRPLGTDVQTAQNAMQNGLGGILTYFTVINPDYTGK